MIGPVAIIFALFRALDKYLMGFVDVIATLAVSMLAIDVVVTLYQGIILQLFSGLSSTNVPDKDVPSVAGLVGTLGIMAFTVVWYLVPLVLRIFGGTGVGLTDGAAFIAAAATRAVRTATGK